jgi:hypothetical protein
LQKEPPRRPARNASSQVALPIVEEDLVWVCS